MSKFEKKADYDVGYKKPPKSGQFQKGKSGNPNGRPPGAKGFAASLKKELETPVTIREGSQEVKISKAEATAKRLVALALKGDMKAIAMLAKFDVDLEQKLGTAASGLDAAPALKPVDLDIIQRFFFPERVGEAKTETVPATEADNTIEDWEIDDDDD